jgi:hypothetical protein
MGFETTYLPDQGATKIDSLSRILLFSLLPHCECHWLQKNEQREKSKKKGEFNLRDQVPARFDLLQELVQ